MIRRGVSRLFAAVAFLIAAANIGGAVSHSDTSGPAARKAEAGESVETSRTLIRSASHADFGRIVIDTTGGSPYQIDQDGDHAVVRLGGDVMLDDPPAAPRNVVALKAAGPIVDLALKHGARLRPMRLDGRIILDVMDPPETTAAPAKPRKGEISSQPQPRAPVSTVPSPQPGSQSAVPPAANPTAERPPVEAKPLPPPDQPGEPPPVTAASATPPSSQAQADTDLGGTPPDPQVAPAPVTEAMRTPPGRDLLPESGESAGGLMARRVRLPPSVDGSAFLVPFGEATAAASFLGAHDAFVVFDKRRPIDLSGLRNDPIFGASSLQLLPNGTLLRVPLPPQRNMVLTRIPQGWRIAVTTIAAKQDPIAISSADGELNFAAEQSSEVVTITDPDSGARLLVGTQRRHGQGVVSTRRASEFIIRPTLQGVVVEPLSDALALRQTPAGFVLTGGPSGLLISRLTDGAQSLIDAASMTRRMDFPAKPTEALLQGAIEAVSDAALGPPLARAGKNRLAAASLIALGLGAEAESLLRMSMEQDPREAASADTGALTAVAALLAGRVNEADAILDPRLDGTDEISLWRAIRQAMLDDGSPAAAATFAVTAPLVLLYPQPIREHILPLIIETMIKGGAIAPAARLLDQRRNDPRLGYARALMQQAEGNTDRALAMLDELANGRDQFDRARAAIRAVEIRLSAHKLNQVQAADALDKLLYAWRGDDRELALRERVADLRAQTGEWRLALTILRQAENDFPERLTGIHERLKDLFAAMIRSQSERHAPAIDFVSAVDENTDLMRDFSDDETVQQSLADRLLALDLPDRAKPVLEKLMRSAKSDVAKARFGLTLATLQFRDRNTAATRTVLDASEGHDLPPDLVEQRTVLRAQAVSRDGDVAAAVATLVPLQTARATEARAQILEDASDWAGAERAWRDHVAAILPEAGVLNEAQSRTVLRLVTAAARANDEVGLTEFREKYSDRIAPGPLADMFRLLVAEPVKTIADLTRSGREATLAASLPADLKALRPGGTQ